MAVARVKILVIEQPLRVPGTLWDSLNPCHCSLKRENFNTNSSHINITFQTYGTAYFLILSLSEGKDF